MNAQLEAAWELHQLLTTQGVPYAIIGGLAVQYWGEPRLTRDVDATILLPTGAEKKVLSVLLEAFEARIPDALAFALKHRVLLVQTASGCNMDLSLGLPGYEEEVVARAFAYDLGDGRTIRLCSAEDLIIHKTLAGRPQDEADIEGVILRQRHHLDVYYIRRWLNAFADLLETPEVLQRFEIPWRQSTQERAPDL